jgi:HK97 family phage prohead protease
MQTKKTLPFEIKAEDINEDGTFEGYASTFGGTPDSYGDVIVEGAFAKTLARGGRNKNGIAMLWQHDSSEPIGIWLEHVENRKGLKVKGKLEIESDFGKRVYGLLKMGAVKGLSIGWDYPRDKNGKIIEGAREYNDKKKINYIKEVELWEISPVTFAANIRADITKVKGYIEKATNEQELEHALRDECNMSNSAAKYIVSLCKDNLLTRCKETDTENDKEVDKETMVSLLSEISCLLKQEKENNQIKRMEV